MAARDRSPNPPTAEKFAALLAERLRKAGDRRAARFDAGEFRLLLSEADGREGDTINLRNFFDEYCRLDRDGREPWWSRTVRGLLGSHRLIPDEFPDARPDLRPVIRTRSYLESLRLDCAINGQPFWRVPYEPIGEYLIASVVYDLPESMSYVNQDQLDEWQVSLYEALEAARQNLQEGELSLMSIGDRLYSPVVGDAYDASRLLLVDKLRQLSVAGEHVAMVVNRDSLLITGSEDVDGLGMMAHLAEAKESEPRKLCAVPLKLADDQWETWLPPADHPHYEQFRLLKIKYLHGEYADQKHLLDKLFEVEGRDQFVATYSAATFVDQGLRSYAVWSRGVPTHLPETDEVFFVSQAPEFQVRASWQVVAAVLGDMLTEVAGYPRRWFVDDFPTAAQLDAMHVQPL